MNAVIVSGAFDLPWRGDVTVALIFTHIAIVAVTVFLHRRQAHHAQELHPAGDRIAGAPEKLRVSAL